MTRRYTFADLTYLMSRLRDPVDGCPWDIKQDYRSIVPHTLEEVYEVIDTIEREDFAHLSEELGDLLFQVVFYAQIAKDDKKFTLDDVIHGLVAKLIYRHPHVFPEGVLEDRWQHQRPSDAQINQQWDALKAKEKNTLSKSVLHDVPKSLPGLLRAKKLQGKAAKVGFDWPDIDQVIDKVHEELDELKAAIKSGRQRDVEDELGDLLFVLANIARHTGVDPEQAVRSTNSKFESRFGYVEKCVHHSGKPWQEFTLAELDQFWSQAKRKERE